MDWQNFHGSAVNAPFTKQPVKEPVDDGDSFEDRQSVRDLKRRVMELQEIYTDSTRPETERRLAEQECDDILAEVFGDETVIGTIELEDYRQGTPKKLGDSPATAAFGNCGGPIENVKGPQGSPDWRRGGGR